MSQAKHAEDSIRSIVAECIGHLYAAFPEDMDIPFEIEFKKNNNNLMISTLCRSVKYSGQKADVKGNEALYEILANYMLNCNSNSDPQVKRYALEGLNAIVFKNKNIVDIKNLENFAYKETKIRTELIEEIDLGPFK